MEVAGGGEELSLNGCGLCVRDDEKVLSVDCGNGYTASCRSLPPESYAIKHVT